MDQIQRPEFETVLSTLHQSFSGDRGVGRAFWEKGLIERVESHALTPHRLKEACGLVRSYDWACLLYTSPSPRDRTRSRMPSSA